MILYKQIVVFVENGVELSGLASKRVVFRFDPNNLSEIDNIFDQIMPHIRENIQERKNTEFLYNLLTGLGIAALVGGTFIITSQLIKK